MVDSDEKRLYTGLEVISLVLNVQKDQSLDDDYMDLRYRQLTPTIDQILTLCKGGAQMLVGEREGRKYNIDVNDVYYIEWVDNHSCICTSKDVYTTAQTLTQLQQQLDSMGFIRISKPMLVNVYKVKWISSGLNMKLMAELLNGERVAINRHYRGDLLNAIYVLGKEAIQ